MAEDTGLLKTVLSPETPPPPGQVQFNDVVLERRSDGPSGLKRNQ